MADSFNSMPARGRFAAAGAGLVVQNRFASTDNKGRVSGVLFLSVMLLALTISLVAIIAILAWAFVEGRTRLDLDLIFNGPSTVNRATAGFSVAIQGTLQIIGGVIAIIIPLGAGAALYLEQFADKTKWWNRLIELNIQNLAGVPSIVFGILGLAFFVRGPLVLVLSPRPGQQRLRFWYCRP
jgi:phosphate transport system permease protein